MRIVYIELNGMKQIRHLSCRGVSSVNQVLALSSQKNLTSDCNFRTLLVSDRTCGLFFIVKDDSDTRLVDAGLSLLVDKFRKISSAHLTQVCNTKNETNGVKNIRLSRSIESSNGIEMRIESAMSSFCVRCNVSPIQKERKRVSEATDDLPSNNSTLSIRLEAINDDLLNVHGESQYSCNGQ